MGLLDSDDDLDGDDRFPGLVIQESDDEDEEEEESIDAMLEDQEVVHSSNRYNLHVRSS